MNDAIQPCCSGSSGGSCKTGSGLAPNIASLLCYVVGLVTGLIFLAIEKENKDVRFHAWQSIFFGIAVFLLWIVLVILTHIPILGIISGFLAILIDLGLVALWIICMVKAYQGERFKLPIIGDMAEARLEV